MGLVLWALGHWFGDALGRMWCVRSREHRQRGSRTAVSQIQYGSQASSLLTTPHFRHTIIQLSQRFTTSVLNRPSQQVRRELALGERFPGFSRPGRSIGPRQKPQESCQRAGGSGMGRERITLKLADQEGFKATVRPASTEMSKLAI